MAVAIPCLPCPCPCHAPSYTPRNDRNIILSALVIACVCGLVADSHGPFQGLLSALLTEHFRLPNSKATSVAGDSDRRQQEKVRQRSLIALQIPDNSYLLNVMRLMLVLVMHRGLN